jgi:hypothetical protein
MSDPDFGPLTALRRLRHVETDAARRDLGDALTLETALAERDGAVRRELDKERRHAGDFDREAFIAWFGQKLTERSHLADATREAEARTAAARTILARRRVAETAAEEALAIAIAARDAVVARREQLMLEDVSRALKRTSDRNHPTEGACAYDPIRKA